MTFLPYTLMNASYTVIGSLLVPEVHPDRLGAIALVYLLAVGVSAHALDATAPNKPWGNYMSKRQLEALAAIALVPALAIGAYYALAYAPLLLLVGALELFFLIAYNLELFSAFFHTDFWFALSWGFLPVIAGFVIQTNTLTLPPLAGGLFGFSTAYVEISASRPYRGLKKDPSSVNSPYTRKFEAILKAVVSSVIAAAALLFLFRIVG